MTTAPPLVRSRGRPSADGVQSLEGHLNDVALQEFVEHGYGGASLSRIVRQARISKTTLYARFASKEALFRHILLTELAATTQDVEVLLRHVEDMEEGLKAFGNRFLEASLRPRLQSVIRLIYSEAYRFPELRQVSGENLDAAVLHISEFLARCAAAAGVRLDRPDDVAQIYVLMIRGWYMNRILFGRPTSDTERAAWVDAAVRTVLRPAPGW